MIVDHHHRVAAVGQGRHDVAAHITCAAGHEEPLCHASTPEYIRRLEHAVGREEE